MIVIYADESGTHDHRGEKKGAQFPIIAGFAATKETWDGFHCEWEKILNEFGVNYFHARELEGARLAIVENRNESNSKQLKKNPYYKAKWDLVKIEAFRKALTQVATSGDKIPVCGGVDIEKFNANKTNAWDQDPYKMVMDHFFYVCHCEIDFKWQTPKDDIEFIFDYQQEGSIWCKAMSEVHEKWRKVDSRFSRQSFKEKRKYPYWPLQAADLLAYRIRRLTDDYESRSLKLDDCDNIILTNAIRVGAKYLTPILARE